MYIYTHTPTHTYTSVQVSDTAAQHFRCVVIQQQLAHLLQSAHVRRARAMIRHEQLFTQDLIETCVRESVYVGDPVETSTHTLTGEAWKKEHTSFMTVAVHALQCVAVCCSVLQCV